MKKFKTICAIAILCISTSVCNAGETKEEIQENNIETLQETVAEFFADAWNYLLSFLPSEEDDTVTIKSMGPADDWLEDEEEFM